jgi:hypothetical protein
MPDVFKILKDLELKAVGLDPETNKMQEGFYAAFRPIGLPIHKEDYENPFSPLGGNLQKNIPKTEPADPKDAPKTASSQIDENKIFAANIARSQQTYLNTFLLTDDKLRMSNQYTVMPSSSKVSDSWWAIITGANGIPVNSELNDSMKQAYEEAQATLVDKDGNPTPHYLAYMDYQQKHREKVRAYNKAYAAAFTDPMKLQNWPIDGVTYHDEASEAWDQWQALGHKGEIETAIATLVAQGTDPAIALIAEAKKRFVNSLNEFPGIGQIPYTLIQPNSWYDPDNDDGWNEYTSTDFHSESHYETSSTSYGGGAGLNVGLFSFGGSFNHMKNQTSYNFQTNNLKISFKYCIAEVRRRWLLGSLLNLDNWFLIGDYEKGCISNGRMSQELPANAIEPTFLPSILVALFLVKDLSISWDNWKQDMKTVSKSTSAGGSIGYGPFAIKGNYSHHNERRDFTADMDGESLVVKGIQLLGGICEINGLAPRHSSAEFLAKPT